MIRATLALALALAALPGAAMAQARRPEIGNLRHEEDWRAWCDPVRRTEALDALKCVDLGGAATLTLGGELRERFEHVRNPAFGLEDRGEDQVLLHRLTVHADLRVGEQFRALVQIGDFRATTRRFGNGSTDRNAFDLAQGFVDLSAAAFTMRGGRQEIDFGSGRLVSIREGPNVRRAFDGVRGFWQGRGWRVDALFVQPIAIGPAAFDDTTDGGQSLWGVYATTPDIGVGKLDLYYLGLRRARAMFAIGAAREIRQSFGVRWFGQRGDVDWDVEGVVQTGRFGFERIAAWTVASNFGWRLAGPLAPRFGLKADIASGDARPRDARLGTFNALYPKLPYFTEANIVAPANLMDLQPGITIGPAKTLELAASVDLLWKHRRADAFYTTPFIAIPATRGGGRWIGWQASLTADWQASPHLTLRAAYVRFKPGTSIRAAGGRTGDFVMTSAAFKF